MQQRSVIEFRGDQRSARVVVQRPLASRLAVEDVALAFEAAPGTGDTQVKPRRGGVIPQGLERPPAVRVQQATFGIGDEMGIVQPQ